MGGFVRSHVPKRAISGSVLLGGSGDSHVEHPPHEQPGVTQNPPNPTMTFGTSSRCCW